MIDTSLEIFLWIAGLCSILFLLFNTFIIITYKIANRYSKKLEKMNDIAKKIDDGM